MPSLSRSFPGNSFPNHGSPYPVLTFHNKQPEASENGYHTTFPAPLKGRLSLLPGPLLQKAYTQQEISWDLTKTGQPQSPLNKTKAMSSDTQKLPSGTNLSFTVLWV